MMNGASGLLFEETAIVLKLGVAYNRRQKIAIYHETVTQHVTRLRKPGKVDMVW